MSEATRTGAMASGRPSSTAPKLILVCVTPARFIVYNKRPPALALPSAFPVFSGTGSPVLWLGEPFGRADRGVLEIKLRCCPFWCLCALLEATQNYGPRTKRTTTKKKNHSKQFAQTPTKTLMVSLWQRRVQTNQYHSTER